MASPNLNELKQAAIILHTQGMDQLAAQVREAIEEAKGPKKYKGVVTVRIDHVWEFEVEATNALEATTNLEKCGVDEFESVHTGNPFVYKINVESTTIVDHIEEV